MNIFLIQSNEGTFHNSPIIYYIKQFFPELHDEYVHRSINRFKVNGYITGSKCGNLLYKT